MRDFALAGGALLALVYGATLYPGLGYWAGVFAGTAVSLNVCVLFLKRLR